LPMITRDATDPI